MHNNKEENNYTPILLRHWEILHSSFASKSYHIFPIIRPAHFSSLTLAPPPVAINYHLSPKSQQHSATLFHHNIAGLDVGLTRNQNPNIWNFWYWTRVWCKKNSSGLQVPKHLALWTKTKVNPAQFTMNNQTTACSRDVYRSITHTHLSFKVWTQQKLL